jgi:hypothetical protein
MEAAKGAGRPKHEGAQSQGLHQDSRNRYARNFGHGGDTSDSGGSRCEIRRRAEDVDDGKIDELRGHARANHRDCAVLRAQFVVEGARVVANAKVILVRIGECFYETEPCRLAGVLKKSLKLRAATSLDRLWHDRGKQAEARDLLA